MYKEKEERVLANNKGLIKQLGKIVEAYISPCGGKLYIVRKDTVDNRKKFMTFKVGYGDILTYISEKEI